VFLALHTTLFADAWRLGIEVEIQINVTLVADAVSVEEI